jgi:hypothetical protein
MAISNSSNIFNTGRLNISFIINNILTIILLEKYIIGHWDVIIVSLLGNTFRLALFSYIVYQKRQNKASGIIIPSTRTRRFETIWSKLMCHRIGFP